MKISDYPVLEQFGNDDELIVETADGTKKLSIGTLLEDIKNNINTSLVDQVYRPGMLYFSFSPVSPAELFGGEWIKLDDCFIRAADDTNTGGNDTHYHNLSSSSYAGVHWTANTVYFENIANSHYTSTRKIAYGSANGSDLANNQSMSDGVKLYGSTVSVDSKPKYQNVHVWRRLS